MTARPDGGDVAVLVHVHYPEIWRDMAPLLARRMTVPFRLLVTTEHPEAAIVRPHSRHMQSFRVLPVQNRGRDILPFLRALAEEAPFDIGLKLHTKKSPQREDGTQWRNAVLDSLLPRRGMSAIVRRMRAEPRAGFVTPAGFALSVRPWVLQNGGGMARVMAALDHELVDADLEDTFFAAGSMFWFRRDALAALATPAVMERFEPEEAQLDGTAAHAAERLFPVEARRQGFLSLPMEALLRSRPGMGQAELLSLARRFADVPSTFFPAPYVAALAPAPLSPLKAAYARLPLPLRRTIRALRGG